MPDSSRLGRAESAGRDDHLAVGAVRPHAAAFNRLDADGPAVADDHLGDGDVGADREVGPPAGGPQVGDARTAPAAVLRGGLVEADAVLLGAVEVAVVGQPVLARLDEGRRELVRAQQVGDAERPFGAVVRCREPAVGLRADKVLVHLVGGPALAAIVRDPAVIVLGDAAREDLGIDGPAAAQHAALGEGDAPAIAVLLRDALIVPLVRPAFQLGEAGRDVDERVAVGSARLEQEDADQGSSLSLPARTLPPLPPPAIT